MTGLALAVHGGAGGTLDADPEYAATARRGIANALAAGRRVLEDGGSAVEAVVAAVAILEDCEAFNAGRGSVLTAAGTVEMDAAVMDGRDRRAGAVAAVRRLVNPVRGALAVMEWSPHVLLVGEGAEDLAVERGLATADPEHFITPLRREQLARTLARGRESPDRDSGEAETVGAVARDARGHLAAATSTGGITAKLPGRASDSCQIGAGTWADDATCAVSGTGQGEFFIRFAFAHEVDALIRHAGLTLGAACEKALASLRAAGGRGGCIAVDPDGQVAMPFNTPGMPRGFLDAEGAARIAIRAGEAPVASAPG